MYFHPQKYYNTKFIIRHKSGIKCTLNGINGNLSLNFSFFREKIPSGKIALKAKNADGEII